MPGVKLPFSSLDAMEYIVMNFFKVDDDAKLVA